MASLENTASQPEGWLYFDVEEFPSCCGAELFRNFSHTGQILEKEFKAKLFSHVFDVPAFAIVVLESEDLWPEQLKLYNLIASWGTILTKWINPTHGSTLALVRIDPKEGIAPYQPPEDDDDDAPF